MAERYYNPFQGMDISVPEEYRETFARYCRTSGRSNINDSPFPRMVDLWFLSICIAVRLDMEPANFGKSDTYKIIEGSIFANDPLRIHALMLIAIKKTGSVEIVSEPRQIMNLANGLAVAGLPKVVEMLQDGDAEPIWNISDALDEILRKGIGA
ncbi:MAG: hypothetical protein JRJ77_08350 [Deltaproteobacteria bacterium]|nr:hypothetical protein [Deltaproteobacteria bacterium]